MATTQQWMNGILRLQHGERLNQLLSVMTGGQVAYVDWAAEDGQWSATGRYHNGSGHSGLLAVRAYSSQSEFQQEQLAADLRWLQQMQGEQLPARLLLLAFSRIPDDKDSRLELETWQWEELLETGVKMAIGQEALVQEVIILPLVAYEDWLTD